jgi:hypothetical protein
VSVGGDDLIAARVIGQLQSAPPADRPDFRVTGGQVVLPADGRSDVFKRAIEAMPGVSKITIESSLPSKVPR